MTDHDQEFHEWVYSNDPSAIQYRYENDMMDTYETYMYLMRNFGLNVVVMQMYERAGIFVRRKVH